MVEEKVILREDSEIIMKIKIKIKIKWNKKRFIIFKFMNIIYIIYLLV
jgi:hypothetical protein